MHAYVLAHVMHVVYIYCMHLANVFSGNLFPKMKL